MTTVQRSRPRVWAEVASVVIALAYAWIAGGLQPFTQPMNIAVALPVVAVVVLVCVRRRERHPAEADRTGHGGVLVWVALLVTLVAWELAAYRSSPRDDHPTLSSIADSIMSTHPGRAGMFLVWLVLGGTLAFLPRARA